MEAKRIGGEIVGFKTEEWTKVAKEIVKPGIAEKFKTHQGLANVLLATKGMIVAESTFDKFWGTGIPIHDPNSANQEKWHGVGILGEILMEIRDDIDKLSLIPKDTVTKVDAVFHLHQLCLLHLLTKPKNLTYMKHYYQYRDCGELCYCTMQCSLIS